MNDYSFALTTINVRLNNTYPERVFGAALTLVDKMVVVMMHRTDKDICKQVFVKYKDILDELFIVPELQGFYCMDIEFDIYDRMFDRVVKALEL